MKVGASNSNPHAINMQKKVADAGNKIGTVKKGALHAELHMKPGAPIPASKLTREKAVAKKKGNTKLAERVQFAINARKWKH